MAEMLTELEQSLVTHIEVYGMPVGRAAEVLGIDNPQAVLKKANVQAARDAAKRQLKASTRITKEDIVDGIKTAIDQAYMLGDPMAQIRGWSEIGKLHDLYSPKRVTVQLNGTVTQVRKELANLPDHELMELIGDEDTCIDADFYRVGNGRDEAEE